MRRCTSFQQRGASSSHSASLPRSQWFRVWSLCLRPLSRRFLVLSKVTGGPGNVTFVPRLWWMHPRGLQCNNPSGRSFMSPTIDVPGMAAITAGTVARYLPTFFGD